MPKAHQLHLETINSKLRARGIDPFEALEACAANEAPHGDAVYAGLAQLLAALGAELVRKLLEQLAPKQP